MSSQVKAFQWLLTQEWGVLGGLVFQYSLLELVPTLLIGTLRLLASGMGALRTSGEKGARLGAPGLCVAGGIGPEPAAAWR